MMDVFNEAGKSEATGWRDAMFAKTCLSSEP